MENLLESFPTVDRIQEHYKSFVFQPDKVSINSFQDRNVSTDTQTTYQQENYAIFTNKLQNPALHVKSLQLHRVTIPPAQTSFPNNECIFLYRRIGATNGEPNYNELKSPNSIRMVRLLRTDYFTQNDPAVYDYGYNPSSYGFNRVFTDYEDLVNELNKAAALDPVTPVYVPGSPYPQQYVISNDIKFSFDSTTNKIIWTPQNAIANGIPQFYYTEVGYDDPDIPVFLKNAEQALNTLGQGELTDFYQPLNVRLGFPWNGLLNKNDEAFPTLIGYRMRPIPDYQGTGWTPKLNYYAQAYANLVYTHNIFLYADIVGGSTEDTNSDLPLLAVVPTTASQLGVISFEPKTENALTKVPQHIYSITIQMKTDTGSDYYLPNSAPVNVELALSY